jgi:predicted nucleotidyltransferase
MKVEEILKEIKQIAKNSLPPDTVLYLFGSTAKNTSHDTSDVDLALENCSEDEVLRFRLLLESISTLRSIDLVDLQKVSDEFKDNILLTAIKLYP